MSANPGPASQGSGIGNIGAVWLAVAGYEPARIAGFFVGTADGGRPLFEVGSVVLAEAKPCSSGAWKLALRADWASSVDFVAQQCGTNPHGIPRWTTWLAATAPKHTALPESPGPRCTWVVVTDSRGSLIVHTFYHSDGTAWQSRGTVGIGVAAVRPAVCQVCMYVRVGGTDDMQVTYHCDATGKWVQIGIWGLPAPTPPPPRDAGRLFRRWGSAIGEPLSGRRGNSYGEDPKPRGHVFSSDDEVLCV